MNDYLLYSSPFGDIILSSNSQAITGLWFTGQKYFPQGIPSQIPQIPTSSILEDAKNWLDAYCQGRRPSHTLLPLQLSGSEFQLNIWNLLLQIPYGKVVTYAQLARQYSDAVGIPRMSPQAVGAAVGRNPISVIVPCHRVIGTSGHLVGYAAGIETKARLLIHEGYQISNI